MSGDHERGDRKGKFCTSPADPCCADCPGKPETYISVCEPKAWVAHTFRRYVKRKINPGAFDKKYEAHHILCVAPVTQDLLGNETIEGAIEQTLWCINNKDNMIAMPLWGHTVKWYCSIGGDDDGIIDDKEAPPFENIPQHDFDHNCKEGYTSEIETEMQKLAAEVEAKDHELSGDSLASALNQLSGKYRGELDRRGHRKDGTHAAWQAALKNPTDTSWSHPFSMASDGKVSSAAFPARDFKGKVDKWIERIANAIKGP